MNIICNLYINFLYEEETISETSLEKLVNEQSNLEVKMQDE